MGGVKIPSGVANNCCRRFVVSRDKVNFVGSIGQLCFVLPVRSSAQAFANLGKRLAKTRQQMLSSTSLALESGGRKR